MKKLVRKVWYWLYIVRSSCRWMSRLNLGDEVRYRGERGWVLEQGVMKPYWTIQRGAERCEGVHESLFDKVRSVRNYLRSFRSGYRFYMISWFAIWVNEGIKPWMNCVLPWRDK